MFTKIQTRVERTERRVPRSAAAVLSCLTGWILGPATANAQNLLTDIGVGTAVGINNSGQVVLQNGIYSNGRMTAFPTGFSGAAINSTGEVAGSFSDAHNVASAATYSNGTVTILGVLPGADPTVDGAPALGINTSGQVVGYGCTRGCASILGFINTNGMMTTVGAAPGTVNNLGPVNRANGINDAGQFTGAAWTDSGFVGLGSNFNAYIYDKGTWTDLGPGEGFAVNASGQVTGVVATLATGLTYSQLNNPNVGHAFVYRYNAVVDMGTLAGGPASPYAGNAAAGYAINATGQIVGASTFSGGSGTHAFYYSGATFVYSSAMQDMNTLISTNDPLKPFVTLTDARGINDSRLVVVNGIDSRTQLTHAYLLQAPWLDVAPGTLFFPGQPVGTTSSAATVALTNAGTAPLALGGVTTSGDFAQTNNCGRSLAPSAGCTVMVTFVPTAAGDRTGSLAVISDGVPFLVPLLGIAPINVTISSSSASVTTSAPILLTWTTPAGATCQASGGSLTDGWSGSIIANSGTRSVTESVAGTYAYVLNCYAETASGQAQASVVVTWPIVTASLTASPRSFTAGQATTLTWSSANANSCSATGGGASDNWPGSKATGGSKIITEPYAPAGPSLNLTFTIICTSSASGQSAKASANVVENSRPPAQSGGGGAFDAVALMTLMSLAGLRASRHDPRRQRRKSTLGTTGTALAGACSRTQLIKRLVR
jgi:probable HAF family extracellular repeat protein